MEYYSPEKKSEDEILEKIASAESDKETIDAVLSAIYYCSTEFSGDLLLRSLRKMIGKNRIYLMNMIESYMQIHRTNYLWEEFLDEVKKPYPSMEKYKDEINYNIDSIEEFKKIFGKNSTN